MHNSKARLLFMAWPPWGLCGSAVGIGPARKLLLRRMHLSICAKSLGKNWVKLKHRAR